MQERTALEDQLSSIGRIEQELDDQITMIELGEAEKDHKAVADAETALHKLKTEVARRELEALLSGEADANDTYVEVHAGAGGTESQDWASMLLRMYTRWAEQHGYKIDWLEETEGEAAGIKTESAVRLTHIPTNIAVVCQNDRSQHRNRAQAWQMLRARLYERELKLREEKAAAEQAAKTDIGWGHQIRSYVLQPYQMVKD